jgi:hypothetical protein
MLVESVETIDQDFGIPMGDDNGDFSLPQHRIGPHGGTTSIPGREG